MKSVVMLGGGIQESLAIKNIQDAGYKVIVVDKNLNAPGIKLADFFLHCSSTDIKKISTWILKEKKNLNIKGIFTLNNFAYEIAVISHTTELPGLNPKIVLTCDDKLLMKRKIKKKIPTARFCEISSFNELKNAVKELGFPSILKITDSQGGIGVQEISNKKQLLEKWKSVSKLVSTGSIILEEKLIGDFIDLQGFIFKKKFYKAGDYDAFFSQKIKGGKSHNPVETLNISPSQHKTIIDDAYSLLEKAARIMGIDWGPIGGDFILTEKGLKIIEISPRLHGPHGTLRLIPYSTNINPLLFLIQLIVGEKPNPKHLTKTKEEIVILRLFLGKSGLVKKIKIPTHLKIIDKTIYTKVGKQYNTDEAKRGAAAIFIRANTIEESKKVLDYVDKNIIFNVTKKNKNY